MKTIKLTENGVEEEYMLTPLKESRPVIQCIKCGRTQFPCYHCNQKTKLEVWRPKEGEYVYVISPDGEIKKWVYYTYNNWCDYRCFKTKEEAQEAHEKALFNYEVEMFIKEKNEGWVPDFGNEAQFETKYSLEWYFRNCLFISSTREYRHIAICKYFKSKEIGKEILAKFDNDKLIKWWI